MATQSCRKWKISQNPPLSKSQWLEVESWQSILWWTSWVHSCDRGGINLCQQCPDVATHRSPSSGRDPVLYWGSWWPCWVLLLTFGSCTILLGLTKKNYRVICKSEDNIIIIVGFFFHVCVCLCVHHNFRPLCSLQVMVELNYFCYKMKRVYINMAFILTCHNSTGVCFYNKTSPNSIIQGKFYYRNKR